MKKARLSVAALLGAALAFALAFASCDSGSSAPIWISPASLTAPSVSVYSSSANLSGYMSLTLGNMNVKNAGAVGADVFVMKQSDVDSLGESDLTAIVQNCLDGKTFVIDAPTSSGVVKLGTRLDAVLAKPENAGLKAKAKLSDESPDHIVYLLSSALSDDDTETSPFGAGSQFSNTHLAIALRGSHIYYVHDISLNFLASSAELFAKWIDKRSASAASRSLSPEARDFLISKTVASESSLNDLVKAQTFTHNFECSGIFQPGWYLFRDWPGGEIKETVELTNDVWAVCNIDEQKDYYLVRESVACHNNETMYGGYNFYHANIYGTMNPSLQTVREQDCSPQTTQGSDSFTTGTSTTVTSGYNVGGSLNIGYALASGLSGGLTFTGSYTRTTGHTVSQSSTRSIPDTEIAFKIDPTWKGPFWDCCVPYKDGWPLPIQKTTAVFDTYAVYVLPSDYEACDGNVELSTLVRLSFSLDKSGDLGKLGKDGCFDDHVKKPCNAKRNYIMSFHKPAGISIESLNSLHSVIKDYVPTWNDSLAYYAVGQSRLDGVAKAAFNDAMKTIEDNKIVLKGRGFEGSVTFYIKNAEIGGDTTLAEKTITF